MIIISIVYLIIGFIALFHYREKMIIYFPILHVAADITSFFYGETASFHAGYSRAIVIVVYIVIYFQKIKSNKLNGLLYLFLIYQFVLILLFSSNILVSLNILLKIFCYFMMFPLAYTFIDDLDKLKLFMKSFLLSYIIIASNLIIANVFRIGGSSYVADSFYEGTGGDSISYSIIFVVLTPLIVKLFKDKKNSKITTQVLFYVAILIVIISVQRTAIVLTALAILSQIFFLNSRKNFITVLLGVVILTATYPYYEDLLLTRIAKRVGVMERKGFENEARFVELGVAIDAFKNGSARHILLGSELHNQRTMSSGDLRRYGIAHRTFHTMFANYLYGSGILGLFMAYLIFIRFWLSTYRTNKFYFNNIREIKVIALLFIMIWFIKNQSFGIWAITNNSILFIFIGAVLGLYNRNLYKMNKLNGSNSV